MVPALVRSLRYLPMFRSNKSSGNKRQSIYEPYTGLLDKVQYRNANGNVVGTDDFSYDNFLRPIGSVSRYGVTRTLAYTDRGQLDSETTTYNYKSYLIGYGYDDRGRLDEIIYPSGRIAAYTSDDRGSLETISWDGSQIEDRTYNNLGLLTGVDRSSVDETRTYDAGSRLTAIANTNVSTGSYTYDANSNKLSESWTGAMAPWNFTTLNGGSDGYDDENRFTNFNQPSKSKTVSLTRSNIGNISNVTTNGTGSARGYSSVHAMTSVGGTAQTFDSDGNLTHSHSGIDLGWDEAGMIKQTVVDSSDTAGIVGINDYGYGRHMYLRR